MSGERLQHHGRRHLHTRPDGEGGRAPDRPAPTPRTPPAGPAPPAPPRPGSARGRRPVPAGPPASSSYAGREGLAAHAERGRIDQYRPGHRPGPTAPPRPWRPRGLPAGGLPPGAAPPPGRLDRQAQGAPPRLPRPRPAATREHRRGVGHAARRSALPPGRWSRHEAGCSPSRGYWRRPSGTTSSERLSASPAASALWGIVTLAPVSRPDRRSSAACLMPR